MQRGSHAHRRYRCDNGHGRHFWNSANSFIFYGKSGEVASNQLEDQELLSLHLLQNCMVYVNTLMIQSVLADPAWRKRLKAEDYRALTPLIYTHVIHVGVQSGYGASLADW